MNCCEVHCCALKRTVQCRAVQCSAVHCSEVQCSAVQWSAWPAATTAFCVTHHLCQNQPPNLSAPLLVLPSTAASNSASRQKLFFVTPKTVAMKILPEKKSSELRQIFNWDKLCKYPILPKCFLVLPFNRCYRLFLWNFFRSFVGTLTDGILQGKSTTL